MPDYTSVHQFSPGYGRTGLRLLPYVKPLLKDLKAHRLLDFGCGKGTLGKKLQSLGYDVTFYDPYVPEFSAEPKGKFDTVLCTDVMEHIPKCLLPELVENLSRFSDNIIFVISLTFADALMPDGTNAHCTIEAADWWREKLCESFPMITEVPTKQATAVSFITWRPSERALRSLRKRRRTEMVKRRVSDLITWPARALSAILIERKGLTSLERIVRNKRVVVVGNARSLADQMYGAIIDAHDVVIRINRGPILSAEASGRRTTILATSIWISSGLYDQRGAKLLLWLTPKRWAFPIWLLNPKRGGVVFPPRLHQRLATQLGQRPSSGLMTVEAVLTCRPSAITLVGFDGFVSQSLSGSHSTQSSPHDYNSEMRHLRNLAATHPILKLD